MDDTSLRHAIAAEQGQGVVTKDRVFSRFTAIDLNDSKMAKACMFDNNTIEDLKKYQDLPNVKTLPDQVQTFLSNLDETDPIKRATTIHHFVNDYIEYKLPEENEKEESLDKIRSLCEIFESRIGDCDDIAHATASLLRYSETFDAKAIRIMGGDISMFVPGTNRTQLGGHAVTIVLFSNDLGDKTLLFDMNFKDPSLLKSVGDAHPLFAEGVSAQGVKMQAFFGPEMIISVHDDANVLVENKRINSMEIDLSRPMLPLLNDTENSSDMHHLTPIR